MIIIALLSFYVVISLAQLQITNLTNLDVLTGALIGLGLPNATWFLSPNDMKFARSAANSTTVDGCLLACHLLRDLLNLNNSLPHNYDPQSEYWAKQQQDDIPSCFVTPGTTPYVAGTVLVLEYFQCPFAIKSGGYSPFGSTLTSPGVVIDLRTFNTISLSRDRSVVTIGAGQNWGTVIDGMGILGYMVPAAYAADVGVGGYTLKGGISYASSRYGFAADNVVAYEVVTANGSIATARPDQHEDLYWALRGGGKGFGIVTRFDVLTFRVPPQFFGGLYNTDLESSQSVFEAFEEFVRVGQANDDGAQFVCAVSPSGTHSILSHLDGVESPRAFESIRSIPSISSTLKVQTMSSLAKEIAAISPRGNREMFTTFTTNVNATWMQDCSQFFIDEVVTLRKTALQDRMLDPWLSFDPLTPGIIAQAAANGGNPMNLERLANGSYVFAHLGFGWYSGGDDQPIRQAVDKIVQYCTSSANETQSFVYPGYADVKQDILEGFGADNKQRLQSIAEAYDPAGWLFLEDSYTV